MPNLVKSHTGHMTGRHSDVRNALQWRDEGAIFGNCGIILSGGSKGAFLKKEAGNSEVGLKFLDPVDESLDDCDA